MCNAIHKEASWRSMDGLVRHRGDAIQLFPNEASWRSMDGLVRHRGDATQLFPNEPIVKITRWPRPPPRRCHPDVPQQPYVLNGQCIVRLAPYNIAYYITPCTTRLDNPMYYSSVSPHSVMRRRRRRRRKRRPHPRLRQRRRRIRQRRVHLL